VLILESLLQAQVLSPDCPVMVLISKYDLLIPGEIDKNTNEFVEYVKSEFAKFGAHHFRDFQIWQISSRPKIGSSLDYGYGVEKVLIDWVTPTADNGKIGLRPDSPPPLNGREADLYLWRRLGQKENDNHHA